MSKKVRLHLSYDGTDFGGWQKQKSDSPTVQGELEKALSQIFQTPIKTMAAGRTDARVHALDQVIHFQVDRDLEKYRLVDAINALTPPSIVARKAYEAPDDFHAIASAEKKTYKYLILNSHLPSPFKVRYCNWQNRPLDLDYLNAVSQFLVGKQDFKSFQTQGTPVKSTIREIYKAKWRPLKGHILEFTIEGNGFLKQMVRNIVGTELDLFYMKQPETQILEILKQKDRQAAWGTAVPQGLYLYRVQYPQELDRKCRKI